MFLNDMLLRFSSGEETFSSDPNTTPYTLHPGKDCLLPAVDQLTGVAPIRFWGLKARRKSPQVFDLLVIIKTSLLKMENELTSLSDLVKFRQRRNGECYTGFSLLPVWAETEGSGRSSSNWRLARCLVRGQSQQSKEKRITWNFKHFSIQTFQHFQSTWKFKMVEKQVQNYWLVFQ